MSVTWPLADARPGTSGSATTSDPAALAGSAPAAGDDRLDPIPIGEGFSTFVSYERLLANDTDPDGGPLTVTAVEGPASLLENGIEYDSSFLGSGLREVFTYTVSDAEGNTDTASVFVEITPRPPIRFTVREDGSIDVDDYVIALGNTTGYTDPEHGTITIVSRDTGRIADVIYTPDPDYNGTDSFIRRESSNPGSEQSFIITVTPENEPPPSGGYVRGTAGADVLDRSGATARVQIAGLEGNDTLRGGSGNDALNGGAGNDVISGGAGADLITGGLGADRMAGGAGADTFLIARGDLGLTNTTDLIVDFGGAGVAGGDVIRLTGFGAGAVLELLGTSGNALAYEVQDAGGANLGRLLVASGGTALAAGDYVFA